LSEQNLHATLFVVGSRVAEYPQYLQNEHAAGHQIAVHTWSHTPLTTQTTEEIVAEFAWSMEVIKTVIGVTPIYMRPPYGDIDDRVRAIALAMGLNVIIWTRTSEGLSFDTFDWDVPGGTQSASGAVAQFETILQTAIKQLSTGFIVLSHDLWIQEVELSTGYFLPAALAQRPKLTIQPIYQCLGLEIGDCYLETNNNATNPVPGSPGSPLGGGAGAGGQAAGAMAVFDRDTVLSLVAPLLAGMVGLIGLF
jgi:peptidoglycan/xylan/chitin deacetylase (PgdA/CDA1 family)